MTNLQDVKADLARVAEAEGDLLCRAALREIEALETKLAKAVKALKCLGVTEILTAELEGPARD